MNKTKIIEQILSELDLRLQKNTFLKAGDLAKSSGANRPFIEQGYALSEQKLISMRDVVLRSRAQWEKPFKVVNEGALLKVILFASNGTKNTKWWFVVPMSLSSAIPLINFGDKEVWNETTFSHGILLEGRSAGDLMEVPPLHGDSRDSIDSILIAEVH